MAQLAPDCSTRIDYYVFTNSSFCVLSDQSTVVGVSNADQKTIIKHSITDLSEPKVTYTANMEKVLTLGLYERQNVLLAGGYRFDSDGQVVQFDLSTGQVLKAFGQIDVGIVWSSISVGNLWIFGTHELSKFAVIDSVSREALGKPIKSAIWKILSMAVCKIQEENNRSQVLLFIIGFIPDYSENKTDVFDITALMDEHL